MQETIERLRAHLAEIRDVEARLQTEVGRFYVSASQLSASLARDSVVTVLREILANLIGSEEIVVLSTARSRTSGSPEILFAWNGDSASSEPMSKVRPAIEQVLASGISIYPERADADPSPGRTDAALSACIALRAGDLVVGAVAVFELLPQKEGLTPADRELCEMIGSLGGQALYCSELHEGLRTAGADSTRPE
jgi:hypothetical protein